ncbi:MAG: bifunctional salicylyl-CoA 5-hydroxylase/oxidoreductase [Polyangia bacterium]
MRIVCIGGGPAGLYLALLMKNAERAQGQRHHITVVERNRPDDTFGFGVVFSDQTLSHLRTADAPSHDAIAAAFSHWDDIAIHYRDQVITSTGHGFAGLSRQVLLDILQRRCAEVGVELRFQSEVRPEDLERYQKEADLLIGSDGINSQVRARYAEHFRPAIDLRPNRFVWLGTSFPFPAFTFYFIKNQHGLWRVHAYRYAHDLDKSGACSTFIVEATEETFRNAGLDPQDEAATLRYCEALCARQLAGHRLLKNRSLWRQFPTVACGAFAHDNVVLLGDAAHTAHFSIGSGTKLALEDAIALRDALLAHAELPAALKAYDSSRRPAVESLQRAAQTSLAWFEDTERYLNEEPLRFAFSLLTRSLRLNHENLRVRDPALVDKVDRLVAAEASRQSGVEVPLVSTEPGLPPRPPPPMFTPFKLRDLVLENRVVVSPMCQYMAIDGSVNDWHLVHLGSRALGGAGLVLTEMTDISAEGRITPGCAGLYADEHVPAWRRIVDFVHKHSRAKIGVQLAHAGRKGATCLLWEGDHEPLPAGEGWPLVAPSALPFRSYSQVPREMTRADMDQITADFARATDRAVAAGFDLLELHLAHGYLLSTFISPLTNLRSDEYGGPLQNRLRFPLEVLRVVRGRWPAERPMTVRISAHDWAPGGLTPDDAVEVARALKREGIDALDVSSGQTVAEARPRYGRLYQTPFAERVRLEVGIATMAVGNISSYSDVNSIIAAGRADLALLARAHLYDPYFTRHAAAEQEWELDWPAPYRSVRRYRPRFK